MTWGFINSNKLLPHSKSKHAARPFSFSNFWPRFVQVLQIMASSGHFREKLSTRGKAGRSPPGKQSNKENLAPKTWQATRRFAGPPRPLPSEQPALLPARPLPSEQPAPLPARPLARQPSRRFPACPPTTALPLSGLSLVRRTSCPFAGLDSLCIAKIAHVCDLARFGRAKKTAPRL